MFGACLDAAKPLHCAGNSALDRLPRDLNHSLANHFEHYSRWAEFAVYDMHYEQMLPDPAAVVSEVATRIGFPCSKSAASTITREVAELLEKSRRGEHTWDPATGLAKDHIHTSSKVQAHKDEALVRRLEAAPDSPCNLTATFAAIEHRYGGWLAARGYLTSAGEKVAHVASLGRWSPVLGKEQQAEARQPWLKSLPTGSPGLVVHVVNYFVSRARANDTSAGGASSINGRAQGFHDWEARLTQQSLIEAQRATSKAPLGPTVKLVVAIYRGDEAAISALEGHAEVCYLDRGQDRQSGESALPLLGDVLSCAVAGVTAAGRPPNPADVVVYTNADIGIQRDFYKNVHSLAQLSAANDATPRSYSITRRELGFDPQAPRAVDQHSVMQVLDRAYQNHGHPHRGHDCFVIPARIIPKLKLGQLAVGVSPWGCTLSAVLHRYVCACWLRRAIKLGGHTICELQH